jgi:two-component system, chemotaxis family, response regulator WspR
MSVVSFSAARPAVVLLVERDAASAAVVRRALGAFPEVNLQVCADPERACQAAAGVGAAVVLVAAADGELPELPGLLQDPGSALPVVVLAQRAPAAFRKRVFAAGAADCLPELPEPEELVARLTALARGVLAERERDEARRQLATLRRRLEERDLDLASGVASRSRLDEFLDGEWRRARRNGSHLSLVIVEVTRTGAETSPAALAVALKAALRRGGDLLASCDENRFAAVLPEVGAGGAGTVARALRQAATTAAPATRLRLGVATLRPQDSPGAGPQSLMSQAHAALAQDTSDG